MTRWSLVWVAAAFCSHHAWAQPLEPPAAGTEDAPAADAPAVEAAVAAAAAEAPAYPMFHPSMRLLTGFEHESKTRFAAQGKLENERYGFFLSQVRVQLEGELTKRISMEVSAELADAYSADTVTTSDSPPYLRDAFLELRVKREFRVTFGHFKRPMSALELRSSGKLQVRGRGRTNDLVIEDNSWGGRGLGAQLWGKLDFLGTTWAVGAFDPAWAPSDSTRPKGVDVLGRVSVEPVAGLTLGANGGTKTLDAPPFDDYDTYYALGGDLKLELAGLNFLADALYAQLPEVSDGLDQQTAFGVVGLASYDIPLTEEFTLQPVVFGEYSDASVDHDHSSTLRGIVGLNGVVHETLRIMPQVEVVRWLGEPSTLSPSEETVFYLMFSLAI